MEKAFSVNDSSHLSSLCWRLQKCSSKKESQAETASHAHETNRTECTASKLSLEQAAGVLAQLSEKAGHKDHDAQGTSLRVEKKAQTCTIPRAEICLQPPHPPPSKVGVPRLLESDHICEPQEAQSDHA